MTEVVTSIKRVTDIMGEISAASTEQSQGVAQVGEAITQMDQVTQQNAALVEEMAAAASSLKSQAQELVSGVEVFKLSSNASGLRSSGAPTPFNRARSVPAKPLPRKLGSASSPKLATSPKRPAQSTVAQRALPAAKAATSAQAGADDWETF